MRVFQVSAYRAARFTDRWMGKARTTRVWVEGNLIFLYRYKLDRRLGR